ncbi:MAG: UDP-N-acetylglucosamine 2-epimerase (non-hydrolyzing) [Bacteroidetes bacterium]|nr:UDP-N-acetylglucosamine 2-epimerase (non-hydrolyzing) [Bacteroidota bacterium]
MKKILIVVGTRPNFIKVTRFKKVAAKFPNLDIKFVHTGQHFDEKMSKVFFDQFNLRPDFLLNIGQGTPNTQMAAVMVGLEGVCQEYKPDLLMVVGDVNSTFAAALTGNKMGIKVAHLESGLRSYDRTMPEEINRLLTDEISDLYFVTEQSGIDSLLKDGRNADNIHFVGNTMIDSLVEFAPQVKENTILEEYQLTPQNYALMTMHRPSNVDEKEGLKTLIAIIKSITEKLKLVFPIHPRTIAKLKQFELWHEIENLPNLIFSEPMDYFSFQQLTANCKFVVTDSGGIQEETTFLQIPCLTLRNNTERPSTVIIGSNVLVPYTIDDVNFYITQIMNGTFKKGEIPPLWDGKSTERILTVLDTVL